MAFFSRLARTTEARGRRRDLQDERTMKGTMEAMTSEQLRRAERGCSSVLQSSAASVPAMAQREEQGSRARGGKGLKAEDDTGCWWVAS